MMLNHKSIGDFKSYIIIRRIQKRHEYNVYNYSKQSA
jgi:hypothetical protein